MISAISRQQISHSNPFTPTSQPSTFSRMVTGLGLMALMMSGAKAFPSSTCPLRRDVCYSPQVQSLVKSNVYTYVECSEEASKGNCAEALDIAQNMHDLNNFKRDFFWRNHCLKEILESCALDDQIVRETLNEFVDENYGMHTTQHMLDSAFFTIIEKRIKHGDFDSGLLFASRLGQKWENIALRIVYEKLIADEINEEMTKESSSDLSSDGKSARGLGMYSELADGLFAMYSNLAGKLFAQDSELKN